MIRLHKLVSSSAEPFYEWLLSRAAHPAQRADQVDRCTTKNASAAAAAKLNCMDKGVRNADLPCAPVCSLDRIYTVVAGCYYAPIGRPAVDLLCSLRATAGKPTAAAVT